MSRDFEWFSDLLIKLQLWLILTLTYVLMDNLLSLFNFFLIKESNNGENNIHLFYLDVANQPGCKPPDPGWCLPDLEEGWYGG